jgi:Signal transduction histidine kinase
MNTIRTNLKPSLIILFLFIFIKPIYCKQYFRNINITQGLSSNNVNAIYRDQKGYLWIGTNLGLNCFDGYRIKTFYQDPINAKSLNNNYIESIGEDYDGVLWINTRSGFLTFNKNNENFIRDYQKILIKRNIDTKCIRKFISNRNLSAYILENYSVAIYNHVNKATVVIKSNKNINFIAGQFDLNGYLWLLSKQSILYKVNPKTGKIIASFNYLSHEKVDFASVFIDSKNNLWIICNESSLYFYNQAINQWRGFNNQVFNRFPLRAITQNGNNIWIGTDHGGIFMIDIKSFIINQIKKEYNDYSLSDNSITSFYPDNDGLLWIGTYKNGVDYFHSSFKLFNTYKIDGLKFDNDINCFAEDKDGNLWIGTNEKGLYKRNKRTGKYTKIKYNQNTSENGTIVSLLVDSKGRIWIGTYLDGLYCLSSNKYSHYNDTPKYGNIDNSIWCLQEDASNHIWIGTLNKGIFKYNDQKDCFTPIKLKNTKSQTIECVFRNNSNKLWFGTSFGIQVISETGNEIKHFSFLRIEDQVSERNYINSIAQDKNGYYWIATQSGLAVLNERNSQYHFFKQEEGLGLNFVYKVIVDDFNNIWVSTSNGLFRIQVLNYGDINNITTQIAKYGKEDGLQDNVFNQKAGYYTKDKIILLGGLNGFNMFNPNKIVVQKRPHRLQFTDLFVNNHRIAIGEEIFGNVLLTHSLSQTEKVELRYDENNIKIEFSALDLLYPKKYKYEYKLDGVDDTWTAIQGLSPYVLYSKLSSGQYLLKVRAIDQSGFGDIQTITLKIEIMPPYWLSWQAYSIYFIIAVLLIGYIIRSRVASATFKYKIQQQEQEKKHLEEISTIKINFFTNLSHELRTPMSLIILPIENIIAKEPEWATKYNLKMVLRNAKRLLFIVNQLLDFRKMEVGEITYNPAVGDLISFVEDVAGSFSDMSQNKNIKYSFFSNVKELYTSFDPFKIERIIFNLLSNAFKFTSNNGTIDVSVLYNNKDLLPIRIIVSDNGIGIEKEKLPNIFKPFYQIDTQSNIANMGTGIGLSIVNEFVRLHQGKINVETEFGKGTSFIIELPMSKENSVDEELQQQIGNLNYVNKLQKNSAVVSTPKEKTILIIDDNDDFRFYLVQNFRDRYNIIEANNGKVAFEKACRFTPDIIISDVIMPDIDGFKLCSMLKKEATTSHIPIILLTASILDKHKIDGFEVGADSFLTKPFNVNVLQARIINLLDKQKELQHAVNNQVDSNTSEIKLSSIDESLIEKVIKITDEKLSDSEFGIEELSKEIGMSSVYLNKKISALTGKTTSEYVRFIRMKKAASLLTRTQLSISEIAYEVGYNSPKYFSKYFKEEYKMLPTQYRKNYL